jgi:hypothetical protein
MSHDEFTKLFKYMEKSFSDMDQQFDGVKSMFGELQGSVDGYAKQILELTQEHLMLARRVDRMEHWIQQIAAKSGVKLAEYQ